MAPRKEPTSASENEKEIELLRLKLEVATMREEIQTLRAVNAEQMEALKENCRLFSKLKPSRDTIRLSSERKMLIAGTRSSSGARLRTARTSVHAGCSTREALVRRDSRSTTSFRGRRATRTRDS